MKIALLTDGVYPYVIGGMQKHSLQLVKYFAQNKHTVYLYHCNESDYDISKLEFFTDEEKQYIHSIVIPFPHKGYFPFHYLVESRQYSELIYQSLKKVIGEIDFIYAQGFCAWDLLRHKTRATPPVAVHFHGLEMFQFVPGLKSNIAKYFLRSAVKFNVTAADYNISYGGKITSILSGISGKEKIWQVPGGIDEAWFTPNKNNADGKIHFAFTGRYERRKGIAELNSAIMKLVPSGGFTFDFIGPIPDEYKIPTHEICYHGQMSSESDIKKILSGADVLVCPSYSEGMPNVIMEGMACGLAIVATDVGAVSLLVNSDNGWLINKTSEEAIYKTLAEVLQIKPDLLQKKKLSSAEKIQNYTAEKVMSGLLNHIEEAKKKVS